MSDDAASSFILQSFCFDSNFKRKILELYTFVNNCIFSYHNIVQSCSGPIGLITVPGFPIGSYYFP